MELRKPAQARFVLTLLATAVASVFALSQAAYGAPGEPLGPPVLVSDAAFGDSYLPAVARAADGRFVVTWSQSGNVFARRFAASGAALGPAFIVNQQTGGFQPVPGIAMNNDDDFAVAWSRQDTGISVRRYAADGTPKGGELTVSQDSNLYMGPPKLEMDADGDFVVAWEQQRSLSSGNSDECSHLTGLCTDLTRGRIRARRYTAGGASAEAIRIVDSAVAVGVDPPGLDEIVSGKTLDWPGVAMAADGSYLVAWNARAIGFSGVYLRRYDAAGAGGPTQRVAASSSRQAMPDLAADAGGGFVVAYRKPVPAPASDDGVFARRYDNRARALGPGFRVDDGTSLSTQYPALAVDPAGNFVMIWGSGALSAQRYAAGGAALGTNFVAASPADYGPSDVASDGNGNFVVTYRHNGEIYVRLFEGP